MKTYLNVQFKTRKAARLAGARWDPIAYAWYLPGTRDQKRRARRAMKKAQKAPHQRKNQIDRLDESARAHMRSILAE